MREKSRAVRLYGSAAAALAFVLATGCLVQASGDNAAHEIAEKFAKEAAKGERPSRTHEMKQRSQPAVRRVADDSRKDEEAEMLARARAEAEQRRQEMLRAREEAERADHQRGAPDARGHAEEQRRIEDEVKAAAAARQAEIERLAEAARKAAETRKAEEAALAAEEARRHAEALRKAEEEVAEARRKEEEARIVEARRLAEAEQQRLRLEAEREAEAQRLTERLRSAREARQSRPAGMADRAPYSLGLGGTEDRATLDRGPQRLAAEEDIHFDPSTVRERRVAVLLLMEPGNRGIRRNNKSSDPVLCGYRDCYISAGPDIDARLMHSRKALGFFRTWGHRAGACNNSLGCVFRGVDLAVLDGMLMPVDMRVVRHDRREPQHIGATSECWFDRGHLACRKGIYADDYAMWVVPESVATRAGPAALMRALEDGLPPYDRTASVPVR